MNNYIGFLIRQARMEANISQESLCKGICAPSYLCKIELGQAEASEEIITHLFAALNIHYEQDEVLLKKARECIECFFFYLDAEEPVMEPVDYLLANEDKLEHSELHLDFHIFLLFNALIGKNEEKAKTEQIYLRKFLSYMNDEQLFRYYLGLAKILGYSEESLQLLRTASRYGDNCVIDYQMAKVLYHLGHYNECIQRAEMAYQRAAREGNPAVLIGASLLWVLVIVMEEI